MTKPTHTNIEKWRPIPGFEGLYEVSNKGRVMSLRKKKIMKTWKHYRGGLRLTLVKNQKGKMYQIHRLVYTAFNGPIPEGYVVRHLNDDSLDNRVENLAVGTYQDNTNDMLRLHGHHQDSKLTCPRNHPLIEGNLVPGQLKRGYRSCLSCDRARLRVKRNPNLGSLKSESDRLFMKLHDEGKISDAAFLSWG